MIVEGPVTENLVWSWGRCCAGGLEPEAAAARRFDEIRATRSTRATRATRATRSTKYSLVSHGPVFRK